MNVQKELLETFVLNKELSNKQQTHSSKHKGRHLLNVSGNIIDFNIYGRNIYNII